MKALVTGGAGFIGSNLVGTLVSRGAQVTVLDNLLSGYALNLRPHLGVRFLQGDVRDPRAVDEAIRGLRHGVPPRRLGREQAVHRPAP